MCIDASSKSLSRGIRSTDLSVYLGGSSRWFWKILGNTIPCCTCVGVQACAMGVSIWQYAN